MLISGLRKIQQKKKNTNSLVGSLPCISLIVDQWAVGNAYSYRRQSPRNKIKFKLLQIRVFSVRLESNSRKQIEKKYSQHEQTTDFIASAVIQFFSERTIRKIGTKTTMATMRRLLWKPLETQ